MLSSPDASSSTSSSSSSALYSVTPTSRYLDDLSNKAVSSTSTTTSSSSVLFDPLIVCGPSGVGKGTIINKYMTELGGSSKFQFTVSHTTRQPRTGEVDGTHYHFVSVQQMESLVEQHSFLESAHVHGNWYGTSWHALHSVQLTGKRALLDVDVQGVKRIQSMQKQQPPRSGDDTSSGPAPEMRLQPRYIFIAPPSLEALEERLKGRGSETPETLARRLANAKAELDFGLAEGSGIDAVITNDNLDQAALDFQRAIERLYAGGV